jgi:hypothetical protein
MDRIDCLPPVLTELSCGPLSLQIVSSDSAKEDLRRMSEVIRRAWNSQADPKCEIWRGIARMRTSLNSSVLEDLLGLCDEVEKQCQAGTYNAETLTTFLSSADLTEINVDVRSQPAGLIGRFERQLRRLPTQSFANAQTQFSIVLPRGTWHFVTIEPPRDYRFPLTQASSNTVIDCDFAHDRPNNAECVVATP